MSFRRSVKVVVELQVDIHESEVDPLELGCSLGFPGLAHHRTSLHVVRLINGERRPIAHDILSVKLLGVRKD